MFDIVPLLLERPCGPSGSRPNPGQGQFSDLLSECSLGQSHSDSFSVFIYWQFFKTLKFDLGDFVAELCVMAGLHSPLALIS